MDRSSPQQIGSSFASGQRLCCEQLVRPCSMQSDGNARPDPAPACASTGGGAPLAAPTTFPSGSSPLRAEAIPARAGSITANIQNLKAVQQRLAVEKRANAKEVRNEERKVRRLKVRARQLTDTDLLQVIQLRSETKAKAEGATSPIVSPPSTPERGRESLVPRAEETLAMDIIEELEEAAAEECTLPCSCLLGNQLLAGSAHSFLLK